MTANVLHCGDCLDVLKEIDSNSIDLIYLDPPFFKQKEYKQKTRDNSEEYSFNDKWKDVNDYYLFMKKRILECKRVLKESGCIFLHCDQSAKHHLQLLLEEVFGSSNLRNEIIWKYRRWSNSKKTLLNSHQTIYFYSKSEIYKFNTIYTQYSASTNLDQILQDRARNENGKCVYRTDDDGNVILGKEKKGVPLSDVWDIPYLNPKAKERTGYPTQKPILLLDRIIDIATDEGDTVLDPFCGSGTTLVAAQLKNRKWIGIDISEKAIELAKSRLDNPIKTESNLLILGEDAYKTKDEYTENLLNSLNAHIVQRNKGIDGFLDRLFLGSHISIRVQKPDESFEKAKRLLLSASNKKNCQLKILIVTHIGNEDSYSPTNVDIENNLLVINSHDVEINRYIEQLSEITKTDNIEMYQTNSNNTKNYQTHFQ